jgi:hypothetical protein
VRLELKIEARALLREIADGANAKDKAQRLNGNQLTFYIQNYIRINSFSPKPPPGPLVAARAR